MSVYRIGEIAEMLGVSSETLRLYERKGLICPRERNEESGYRYYSSWELHMLLCARIYSSMGVRLEQLAQILEDPFHCEQEILACIRQKEENWKQQLQYIQYCLQRAQDIQRFMEDVERSRHTLILEKRLREGIYILQNQYNGRLCTEADARAEFAQWTRQPEFLFSAGRIERRALQENKEDFFFGIGIEEKYAEMLSVTTSGNVRYFPPQMCLYTVVETSENEPLCVHRVQQLLEEKQIDIQDIADDITTQTIFMTRKDSDYCCFHGIYIPIYE